MTDETKIKLLSSANKTTCASQVYCNMKIKGTNISGVTKPMW
jgi:hypothetical protein